MKKPRRRVLRAFAVSALLGTGVLFACSSQGEGEPCEVENGDGDCATDLVCVPATTQASNATGTFSAAGYTTVNPPYDAVDRCCPRVRGQATHPACVQLAGSAGSDAAPPADTGPATPSVTPDGGSDAADASDAAEAADAPDAD